MNKKDILDNLIPYLEKNDRYFLLLCDTGFGAIDYIKKIFPGRIINAGIMEQAIVSIASGMAMTGLIPIIYGMANFLCFRALEQIRNDVVLQTQNVKLIGIGANDYFAFLGKSHTCGDNDRKLMQLIGMKVYDPYVYKKCNYREMLNNFMESDTAGYLRV